MNRKRRSRSFQKYQLFQVKALQFHSKTGYWPNHTKLSLLQRKRCHKLSLSTTRNNRCQRRIQEAGNLMKLRDLSGHWISTGMLRKSSNMWKLEVVKPSKIDLDNISKIKVRFSGQPMRNRNLQMQSKNLVIIARRLVNSWAQSQLYKWKIVYTWFETNSTKIGI